LHRIVGKRTCKGGMAHRLAIFYRPVSKELCSPWTCTSISKSTTSSSSPSLPLLHVVVGTRAAARPHQSCLRPFSPPSPPLLPPSGYSRAQIWGLRVEARPPGGASGLPPPKLADGGADGAPGEEDSIEGEEDVCWPLVTALLPRPPPPLAPSSCTRLGASSPSSRRGRGWPASHADTGGRRAAAASSRRWPAGAASRGLLPSLVLAANEQEHGGSGRA
jgi:hypothetical protein